MEVVRCFSALVIVASLASASVQAQPGACSPTSPNPTCATATALVSNAACTFGTTCNGGAQGTSTCLFAGSQCSWYSFTATATSMYVYIDVQVVDGCNISSNVYRSAGGCANLTQISCVAGAPLDDTHLLNGLIVGSLYFVQVCYPPGGPCGNGGSAEFCIEVGIPDPPCNTCSTPCGDAVGFATAPSVSTVVSSCTTADYNPPLMSGASYTFCNSFVATNSTVSFNVVITSDCGSGNVSAFTWALYNSPSCGGAIQTGTLASLVFNGLTVGNTYVYCYSFTVPVGCQHYRHCPYFVGAFVPLPVTWLGLEAKVTDDRWVQLDWATASEQNNDHFTVERSRDALNFEDIGQVPGAGHSITPLNYRFVDVAPYPGVSYYRIRQTDYDGMTDHSNTVPVVLAGRVTQATIVPNPAAGDATLVFQVDADGPVDVRVHDAYGKLVLQRSYTAVVGPNALLLGTAHLAQGVYAVSLGSMQDRSTVRFFKD